MRARAWTTIAMFAGALTVRHAKADEPHEAGGPGVAATDPVREGFTLELGIGAALTIVSRTSSECSSISFGGTSSGSCGTSDTTEAFAGYAPLSFGIGGFFSEDVALLFRASSTAYFDRSDNWLNAFYGPVIQLWPGDRVMFAAGVGLGVFAENPLLTRGQPRAHGGLAFSARAGYALFVSRDHALRGAVEVLPAFYDRRSVVGTALLFEWQLL